MRIGGISISWKVLAALAGVGLGIFVLAPSLGRSMLPVLLLAACPLSMIFVMRGMQGGRSEETSEGSASPATLDELRARLDRAQAEQDAIATEIARLEADAVTAEAEAVVDNADRGERPEGPAAS